jgi:hypothetical protein
MNVVMLNVIMLNFVFLNVIMLNAIMLNVIMQNVIMQNVIMLNVVMLNVITLMSRRPSKKLKNRSIGYGSPHSPGTSTVNFFRWIMMQHYSNYNKRRVDTTRSGL